MKETCGCCEGIHESTPAEIRNRPGLSVLSYRVGTHATFLETMKARLSSLYLKDTEPGGKPFKKEARPYPLGELKTREADDPAIALLDAWSTVADVLTFYQERIANEGYLRTATERRSVLELARLVGYNLRPGVAASTFFAYTLEKDSAVTIPAGSRAQSVPGPGETLQSFETSHDLAARTEWNTLQPRLTEPQAPDRPEEVSGKVLYFKGTATNLKPNDPILIDFGPPRKPPVRPKTPRRQELFRVMKVEPDSVADRTKVTLQLWVRPEPGTGEAPLEATMKAPAQLEGMSAPQSFALRERVQEIVEHYSDETEFGEILKTSTGKSVAEQLETLRRNLDVAELSRVIEKEVLPKLQEKHRAAIEGNFTRLEPWIQQLITDLEESLASVAASQEVEAAKNIAEVESSTASASPSAKTQMHATISQAQVESIATDLNSILSDLEKPPSIPPPNPQRLDRSIEQVFGPKSDITTSLLTALRPAVAPLLVKALENQPVTPPQLKVYALRTRASVFGHNAPLQNILEDDGPDKGKVIGQQEWTLVKGASGAPENFNLKIRFLREFGGTAPPRPGFKTKLKIGDAPEIESTLIPTGPQMPEYKFDIHYPQAGEDPIKVKLKVFPIVGGQISLPAAFNDGPPFILEFDFPTRNVIVTCDFSQVISQVFATKALDPMNINF